MKLIQPEIKPIRGLDGQEALLTIQRCAKTCYKSYKDSDDIESAKRIVKNLIVSGHTSLLENWIITMNYISNIAAYKDLTRHRVGFSFSIESTRWCNYSKGKYNGELKFLYPSEIEINSPEYQIWLNSMLITERNYLNMAKLGAKPDQMSLILPQSTAAEFNITGNLRAWRQMFDLRALDKTGHARKCIKDIMIPTLELFHEKIPVVFDDQYEELQQKRAEEKLKEAKKAQLLIPFEEFKQNKR